MSSNSLGRSALRTFIGACVPITPFAAHALQADDMAGMPGMGHHEPTAVSAKTRAEIAEVRTAAATLATTSAAQTAGYHPVFGWIATMGVHWIDSSRMTKAAQGSLRSPDNLMFSRVDGHDTLVGAAFAYFTAAGDTTVPPLFDDHPAWHEHENLAPPGETLVMLHVWFVPSPDGPFAGTNPNLPFWAAGLAAPDSARMHDAAFNARVRRAALAIAEATDFTSIFPRLGGRPALQQYLAPRRDSVRAAIAEMLAAQKRADPAAWDRAADRAATLWDSLYHIYLGAASTPEVRARIEHQAAMLLGQHEH